jgi:hypothetical protein
MQSVSWHVRRFAALLVGQFLIASLAAAQDVEALKAGVVKMRSRAKGQPKRTGTGFIVVVMAAHALMLTASHVV